MLYPFASVPLIRLALVCIPGIILGKYFPEIYFQAYILMSGLLILWMVLSILYQRKKQFVPELAVLLLLAFFSAGCWISGTHYSGIHYYRNMLDKKYVEVYISVQNFPGRTAKGKWKITGELMRVKTDSVVYPVGCGIQILTDSLSSFPVPGSVVHARLKLQAISDTSAGYAGYLLSSGILFQGFSKYAEISEPAGTVQDQALALANECRTQLFRYLPEEDIAGLCTALVTGDRSALDRETAARHRMLGTTHILSVSGLHVGLICMVLIRILSLLDKGGVYGQNLRIVTVMFFLSLYAVMTGLAPSVCRAVIMALVSMTGRLIRRQTPIENALAFTCILELMWNPSWLFYPGFQLSFAALAGLIWMQPVLMHVWEPGNSLVHKLWEMSTATLAAQWCTFPFLIPLAAGFPLYFLPANLIIVPLASALTALSFILILISPIPVLPEYLGICIRWMSYLLDGITIFLSRLPGAMLEVPFTGIGSAVIAGILMYAPLILLGYRAGKKSRQGI